MFIEHIFVRAGGATSRWTVNILYIKQFRKMYTKLPTNTRFCHPQLNPNGNNTTIQYALDV